MVTTPMIPLCKHLLTDMLANICLFTHPAIMEQVIPHNCKYKQASVDLRDLNVKLIQTSDRKCVRFHVLGYITREKIQALWVTGHCVCCKTGVNGAFSSNPAFGTGRLKCWGVVTSSLTRRHKNTCRFTQRASYSHSLVRLPL